MNSVVKFVKSSAVYFLGSVMTKVISFFLLPLYTNYISTADFGYYDLSISYINVLVPVICMEIWSGIMRYMFDFEAKEQKYHAIFNGMVIFSGSVVLYALIGVVLGLVFDINMLFFIFLYGFFSMLQNIYSYTVRGLGYNASFAISGILGSLINSLSNIVMILCFGMRLNSLYIALILGLAFQVIFMECRVQLFRHLSFRMFDWQMIKRMIRFSLPLCFNSAFFWFLSSYNRVGISNTLGLEANGLYSVAAKFTYVLGLVSNCFSMAWQEMVYSMGNEKENKSKLYTTASNYYIKFLMYGMVLLVPAVSIIFPYMIGPEYRDAYSLVPLYLFATVESIYSVFLGNIFGAEKKTGVIFYSTLAAAAANVSLFHLLVGRLGVQAANISLSIGFFVIIMIRLILLNRSIAIQLDYKMIIFTTILFIGMCWVYAINIWWVSVLAFLIAGCITLFAFKDFLKQALQFAKTKLKKS